MPDLVDVVVVGGGILGTAITYALARRNLRVTLLEVGRLGMGATGGGFGWVNATYKTDDEAYFRLNAQAVTHYDRMAGEWGEERLGVHGGGSLFWADQNDAASVQRLQSRARLLQAWNYPAALLSSDEVAVLEPHIALQSDMATTAAREASGERMASALFAPADKWIDTARLCRFFVEQARAHKADIRLDCPAIGFTRSVGNAISTVESPQGRISAPLLVLAAGADTPRLAALTAGDAHAARHVPVQRVPGLLVQTPRLSGGQQCGRVLYPPDPHGLHLRPTSDGGLLIGADDTDAWLNDPGNKAIFNTPTPDPLPVIQPYSNPVYADSLPLALSSEPASNAALLNRLPPALWQGLLARAALHLPALSAPNIMAHAVPRICVRPVPADGLPSVGALPGVRGAYVAVTHSGITLGPLLADLLGEEMFTRVLAPVLAPYRPGRF